MRIKHCGIGGCGKACLGVAKRLELLVVNGGGFQSLAGGRVQAGDGLIDGLDGFANAAATVLSAPSSITSASLDKAIFWVSRIFLARSFSASWLGEASKAGPWLESLALSAASCRGRRCR